MKEFWIVLLGAVLATMLLAAVLGCDLPKGPERKCTDSARDARLEKAHQRPFVVDGRHAKER